MIMINTELLKWLLCDNRNPVEEEKQLLASNFTFFLEMKVVLKISEITEESETAVRMHFIT